MKEDIIKLARRAGAHDNGFEVRFVEPRYLERFAALVRADEREACAKICDEWHQACCKFETQKRTHHYIMGKGAAQCAHSIRARGVAEQEPVKRTVMYRPADLEALGLTHEDVVNLIKEQS
jgi:hypothetical protein